MNKPSNKPSIIAIAITITTAVACSHAPTAPRYGAAASAESASASCSTLEPNPIAGADDTARINAAVASTGCVSLRSGHYTIVAAPWPRAVFAVDLPAGAELRGIEGQTVIDCTGDGALHDWDCIRVATNGVHIHGIHFVGSGLAEKTTTEHTPLVKVDPSVTTFEYDHNVCTYPVLPGTERGDCLWIVGYPGRLVTGIHVHHVLIESSSRAGIAYHSGAVGRIDHVTCLDVRAPCIDGEGSGGSTMEIDHVTDYVGPHAASNWALNIQFDIGDMIHDNHFLGRGIADSGCDNCRFYDNEIRLDMPTTDPVIYVAKYTSSLSISDSVITRSASAGPGMVLRVTQKITIPWNVILDDLQLILHTSGAALQTIGLAPPADVPSPPAFGIELRRVTATTDVPALLWDAEASGAAIDGSGGTRTSGLVIDRGVFLGPWSKILLVSGSYAGTGWLSIVDSSAPSSTMGLVCSGIGAGRGVLGPVTYLRNAMPAPSCGSLISP